MGKIYAFPTDTVFGVGAYYKDEESIKEIYNLKSRPMSSPLVILCATVEEALRFFDEPNEVVKILAEEFWPGALTIIFKKSSDVPPFVNSKLDTVGIRVPNNETALKLLKEHGPMATTSVNKSGKPAAFKLSDVKKILKDETIEILSDELVTKRIPSTVISVERKEIKILREGILKLKEINRRLVENKMKNL